MTAHDYEQADGRIIRATLGDLAEPGCVQLTYRVTDTSQARGDITVEALTQLAAAGWTIETIREPEDPRPGTLWATRIPGHGPALTARRHDDPRMHTQISRPLARAEFHFDDEIDTLYEVHPAMPRHLTDRLLESARTAIDLGKPTPETFTRIDALDDHIRQQLARILTVIDAYQATTADEASDAT